MHILADTFKYDLMYLHVFGTYLVYVYAGICMYMTVYACITNSRLLE